MKSFAIVCLFALLAFAQGRPGQYTDKYDNINVDEVLTNDRLLKGYVDCALGLSACTAEGKELKAHIQEALENKCANCTEAQKNGVRKVIAHLINKEPEYWKQLCAKYDPQNKYTTAYEKELREITKA